MNIDLAKKEIWDLDKNTNLESIKVDKTPLWWFFKPTLILNTLPSPFQNFDEITKETKKSTSQNLRSRIASGIIRKYILKNEKSKIKFRKQKEINKKEKLLLLTYSNHIKDKILRLQSILDKIKTDKRIEPFLLTADLLSNGANKTISTYDHTIYEYITPDIIKKSESAAKKINKIWKRSEKTEKQLSLITELDFLLSKETLELIFIYYLASKSLIKKENIKEILITADTLFIDRALIAAANYHKIPIISVHHGNPGTVPIEKVTKICLKGNAYKKNLEKTNFEGEIVITGSSDYDEIQKFKKPMKNTKKQILIVTSPLVEDNFMSEEEYNNYFFKLIKDINKEDIEITISLHPRENNSERYENLTKNYKNIKVIKKLDINFLYKLLNNTDVLIFFGSGVATEAMILDKPCIYIDLFGENNPYISLYKDTEAVLKLKKEDEVSPVIEKTLTDKKLKKEREKFIEENCYKVDGKSTERIVNEIYKSLENGTRNTK